MKKEIGDKGGFIEKEENLSNSRIYGNTWDYENARISGGDWVYGNARVYGDAWVYGKT